jgi:glycosyltransferase involved in cell wall biosynthesis
MDISVVIGLHNEGEKVNNIYKKLTKSLENVDKSYELLFVDDSSKPETWNIIKELQKKDPHVKAIKFRRLHGETARIQAGFDHAKGESIFTIGTSIENFDKELLKLIKKAEESSFDMIIGTRKGRHEGRKVSKALSIFAHKILFGLIKHQFTDVTSPYRYIRKDLAKNMKIYGDNHLIFPAIAALYGAKFSELEIDHGPTKALGLSDLMKLIMDMILVKFFISSMTPPFNAAPMRILGGLGSISVATGFVTGAYLTVEKIVYNHDIGGRPLLSLSILLLILGALFLVMGFLGELIMRSYFEGQNKPTYTVEESLFT